MLQLIIYCFIFNYLTNYVLDAHLYEVLVYAVGEHVFFYRIASGNNVLIKLTIIFGNL